MFVLMIVRSQFDCFPNIFVLNTLMTKQNLLSNLFVLNTLKIEHYLQSNNYFYYSLVITQTCLYSASSGPTLCIECMQSTVV